jgi:hypothetical protein
VTDSTQPAQAALPIRSDEPAPPAAPPAPWYVKTPGARPAQAEISISPDHVINRQGKDFVLFAGLLTAAHAAGLQSISTHLVQCPSAANGGIAIVHATAEFGWGSFSGIGDADDGNVSRNIQPHKIRMAETRAKARALRDALNVNMVAIEEMGPDPSEQPARTTAPVAPAGNGYAQEAQTFDRAASRFNSSGSGAAPRRVENRPDGSTSVTSSPGTRKSYGTPMTRPPVQG